MKYYIRHIPITLFITLFCTVVPATLYGMLSVPQRKSRKPFTLFTPTQQELIKKLTPEIQETLKKDYQEAIKIDQEKRKQDEELEEKQKQQKLLGLSSRSETPKIVPHVSHISIICADQSRIYVPANIATMSISIKDILDFKKWEPSHQYDVIELSYPRSVVYNAFKIIERKEKFSIYEQIKNYSLVDVVNILECLSYLQFNKDILKPFYDKIFSLNTEEIENNKDLILSLNAQELIEPITQLFRNTITRKSINNKNNLEVLQVIDHNKKAIFSPDNKMIASATNNVLNSNFLLWKIDDDGNINSYQIPQSIEMKEKNINELAFAPDSKKIAIGCTGDTNNLFVYDINDGIIRTSSLQILKGHCTDVTAIAFHPMRKVMVSASGNNTLNNIFLWEMNQDGTIKEEPKILANSATDLVDIHDLSFSADGTMLICGGQGRQKTKKPILVWEFDQDGTLKDAKPKSYPMAGKFTDIRTGKDGSFHMNMVLAMSFIGESKKFIVTGMSEYGPIICEIIDETLRCKAPYFGNCFDSNMSNSGVLSCVSANGKIFIIGISDIKSNHRIVFFNIDDDYNLKVLCTFNSLQETGITFSSDSNKIISCKPHNILIRTLVSKDQQKILDDLKRLNAYQLLLIYKELENKIGLNPVKNVLLEQEEIPKVTITLLQKLKDRPVKKLSKRYQKITTKPYQTTGIITSSPNFLDWLKKWTTETFWSDVKTITPKE